MLHRDGHYDSGHQSLNFSQKRAVTIVKPCDGEQYKQVSHNFSLFGRYNIACNSTIVILIIDKDIREIAKGQERWLVLFPDQIRRRNWRYSVQMRSTTWRVRAVRAKMNTDSEAVTENGSIR